MEDYDPTRRCPKCGTSHADVKYITYHSIPSGIDGTLRRTCAKCNHHWYEWPLDHQEAPNG